MNIFKKGFVLEGLVDLDFIPSFPPDREKWEERRNIYDAIWSQCIHENGSFSNEHVSGLKWELERCFCSGSWIAVVIISAAIVEVHLSHIGKWKKENNLLKKLDVEEDWNWLKKRRNYLVHGIEHKNSRLPASEYRNQRDKLQSESEKAIKVALMVALNNP